MEKSKYLELAHQKGWDVKIPQLADGTYNCDVFGGDGVELNFDFSISGILYLKASAFLSGDVYACDGIILGDDADTYMLSSHNGDIILGHNADTCGITGKNIICGDNLYTNYCNISAIDGFVILGKNFNDNDNDDNIITVSATEDIIYDEPTA